MAGRPRARHVQHLPVAEPDELPRLEEPGSGRRADGGRSATDPAARKQAYSNLQKAMANDLPIWAYAESQVGPIYSKKVTGVEMYNTGVVFMDRIGLS
ncbi:hypothetical protein ACU686_39085 [Yinghuangia aomiensis]